MAMDFVRSLITATPLFGLPEFTPTKTCRPLLLDKELGVYTLGDRWRCYDPDGLTDTGLAWSVHDLYLDEPSSEKRLEDVIRKHDVNVVIVDPINRFTRNSISDNDVVRSFLERVDRIIDRNRDLGLSFVLVCHSNKPPKDGGTWSNYDPLDMYSLAGAASWINVADTVLTCNGNAHTPKKDQMGNAYWNVDVRVFVRHGQQPSGDLSLTVKPSSWPPVRPSEAAKRRTL